jgi:hypothetical protein
MKNKFEIQVYTDELRLGGRGGAESRMKRKRGSERALHIHEGQSVYMAVCEWMKVELHFHYETKYKIT